MEKVRNKGRGKGREKRRNKVREKRREKGRFGAGLGRISEDWRKIKSFRKLCSSSTAGKKFHILFAKVR